MKMVYCRMRKGGEIGGVEDDAVEMSRQCEGEGEILPPLLTGQFSYDFCGLLCSYIPVKERYFCARESQSLLTGHLYDIYPHIPRILNCRI